MAFDCPILGYILALPDVVSIIAITTEGEKMLINGSKISKIFSAVYESSNKQPTDFPFRINCHTFGRNLPSASNLIGTYNDRHINPGIHTEQNL